MLSSRAVSSIARCSSCRYNLLSTFTAFAGISIRPAIRPRSRLSPTPRSQSSRFLSSAPTQSAGSSEQDQYDLETPIVQGAETSLNDNSQITEASVPWYLQVESPPRMENPRAARQQLPELPVDTPALLQPILEHISIGLGLDDLSLFDLRKLDPPPALGANLLMVMGTARSEKHLHVSADRFCRWLRTTYKLSPYADGLLGRNELKLKTRRKVRRARLLSSVGSVEKNADDGIRTGWVCVNIGVIEAVQNKRQEPERLPGYIGFGGQTEGVKLVVQMFTEEKREELDLEGLWGGFLARQQRKEAREAVEQQEEAAGVEEVDPAIGIPMTTAIDLSLKAEDPSFEPMRLPQMYRNFHPSA